MSVPQVTDKDLESFFAARPEPFFEDFFGNSLTFDVGHFPPHLGPNDSLLESRYLDGRGSHASPSFSVPDILPSTAPFDLSLRCYPNPRDSSPHEYASCGPIGSRKVLHQLRPDGLGISGSELLSLEGQLQRKNALQQGASSSSPLLPPHSTPPITPKPKSVRPRVSSSPIRKPRIPSRRSKSQSVAVAPKPLHTDLHSQTQSLPASSVYPQAAPDEPLAYIDFPLSPPASSVYSSSNYEQHSTASGAGVDSSGYDSYGSSYPSAHSSTIGFCDDGNPSSSGTGYVSSAYASTASDEIDASAPWHSVPPLPNYSYPLATSSWGNSTASSFDVNASLCSASSFDSSQGFLSFDASQLETSGMIPHYADGRMSQSHPKPRSNSGPAAAASLSGSYHAPIDAAPARASIPPLPHINTRDASSTTSRALPKKRSDGQMRPHRLRHSSSLGITRRNASTTGLVPRAKSHSASASGGSLSNGEGDERQQGQGQWPAPGKVAASPPIGFVNFTPSDSRKLLTGVAPSGSSKTKARREREAIERRRRISEAAARAVRDAGGDLNELHRQGIFEEWLQ